MNEGTLFTPYELSERGEQVGKTAGVIKVRMGDEERAGVHNINTARVCRMNAALSGVKPVVVAVDLKNERAVMHSGHRLGAGAGSEEMYLYHIKSPVTVFYLFYHARPTKAIETATFRRFLHKIIM